MQWKVKMKSAKEKEEKKKRIIHSTKIDEEKVKKERMSGTCGRKQFDEER